MQQRKVVFLNSWIMKKSFKSPSMPEDLENTTRNEVDLFQPDAEFRLSSCLPKPPPVVKPSSAKPVLLHTHPRCPQHPAESLSAQEPRGLVLLWTQNPGLAQPRADPHVLHHPPLGVGDAGEAGLRWKGKPRWPASGSLACGLRNPRAAAAPGRGLPSSGTSFVLFT